MGLGLKNFLEHAGGAVPAELLSFVAVNNMMVALQSGLLIQNRPGSVRPGSVDPTKRPHRRALRMCPLVFLNACPICGEVG